MELVLKRTTIIALFLFLPFFSSAGLIIEVDDNIYEMTTVTGLLSEHRATIENQIWFGDSDLARQFSNELKTQLAAPFNWGLGPVFGFEIYDGVGADYTKGWFYKPSNVHLNIDNRAQVQNATAGVYFTYAVAEHVGTINVPEPNPLYLFLLVLPYLFYQKRFFRT